MTECRYANYKITAVPIAPAVYCITVVGGVVAAIKASLKVLNSQKSLTVSAQSFTRRLARSFWRLLPVGTLFVRLDGDKRTLACHCVICSRTICGFYVASCPARNL